MNNIQIGDKVKSLTKDFKSHITYGNIYNVILVQDDLVYINGDIPSKFDNPCNGWPLTIDEFEKI